VADPVAAPAVPVQIGEARSWSITDTTVPADLVHFAEPGETLYSIAAAYGVSLRALTAENALSTAPLAPGTPVYLPERRNPAAADPDALPPIEAEGLALVYPAVMAGRRTESGEPYDPDGFTVSHREYPFGTVLLVTNPATGRSTFARVTDRGPVSQAYLVELSAAAAAALDLDPAAAQSVELRRLP
jgi:rare lipoprotein A (peptidoglycan hydrolase)